ncbi:hypothetical protein PCH_Pc12g13340 [Penicillium rubens Wisconsin 54-1255]|uniref:Uncharacterized protein n=1 Tax=Penicillium rubens (strain ATCC 28089 / DSM 1075 / NRRL 1951 / Wisconsin 54-1255) TaxID=500485 RepID=B6GZT3_PENRW|nr:hypothetical protein PCH_Pc12g13340 [Penicillium rubens Wisconsin 54-1255]
MSFWSFPSLVKCLAFFKLVTAKNHHPKTPYISRELQENSWLYEYVLISLINNSRQTGRIYRIYYVWCFGVATRLSNTHEGMGINLCAVQARAGVICGYCNIFECFSDFNICTSLLWMILSTLITIYLLYIEKYRDFSEPLLTRN